MMQIVKYMVDMSAGLCGGVWKPAFSPLMWHEPSWTKGEQLVEVRTSLCLGRALPPLHLYSGAYTHAQTCTHTRASSYTHTHTHTHISFIGVSLIANSFPSINWRRYTSLNDQCSVRVLTNTFMLMKLLYLPKCRLPCIFITSFMIEHSLF
jgi:hypothetical protein